MQSHAMVIKADARAMSAVTATDTRVSSRWQASNAQSRKFDGKPFTGTSDCISYRLDDDGNKVDARIFRATRATKPNRRSSAAVVIRSHATVDIALMATMGTIHNEN